MPNKQIRIIAVLQLVLLVMSSTALANNKSLKSFKSKEALCNYLEERKDQAEERMLRGYTVKQYNKLEAKRKYWKNKYIEHCF